jgi:hypothetical protein
MQSFQIGIPGPHSLQSSGIDLGNQRRHMEEPLSAGQQPPQGYLNHN